MGGKSQPTQAPPPPTVGDTSQPSVDTEMMGQLMQMMAAQAAASAAMAAMPQVPEVPPVYTSPEIDWTEQIDQLNSKVRSDEALDRARKKSVADTVHTGSLLDDSEPSTTKKSILG